MILKYLKVGFLEFYKLVNGVNPKVSVNDLFALLSVSH